MAITVDTAQPLQEILGFGGAITDAVAEVYDQLSQPTQAQLIRQLWGRDGARFSFARVPMNAADFSRMNYGMASRHDLSDWCLRDDRTPEGGPLSCGEDYKLGPLQAAIAEQPDLKVFVSTWSAPPSFKDQHFSCKVQDGMNVCMPEDPSAPPAVACNVSVANPNTCNTSIPQGHPCSTVPPTHVTPKATHVTPTTPIENAAGNCWNTGFVNNYSAWARYFRQFIHSYANASVPIWGVTAQNEPLTQTGLWGSDFYTQANETDFVTQHLSPVLREAFPDIKIMIHDDQVTNLVSRAVEVARAAGDHVDGIAYHWYNALEGTFENGKPQAPLGLPKFLVPNLVNGGADVRTVYEDLASNKSGSGKFMLMTEACSGYSLSTSWVGPRHGEWGYGYSTAHDMLWQLRNRAAGWVYWNVLLDAQGGPNLAGNYVDSPTFWVNETAIAQNPSFFTMMHFSRYVPPGSVVVEANVTCAARRSEYCQFVTFRTPQGRTVVVMTNDEITVGPIAGGGAGVGIVATPWLAKGQGSITLGSKTLSWSITCTAGQTASGTLPWRSIQTVVLPC